MDTRILPVEQEEAGMRIDLFLSRRMEDMTRSSIQRLCDEGNVLVGGKAAAKNYKLRAGDRVEVTVPPPRAMEVAGQDIPISVVYEDSELLVVDKPKGMVVHPAAGNEDGTLVNALLHYCVGGLSGIGGVQRPGIVHRIDKDTSGLLVVAKTDRAHRYLSDLFKEHNFTRRYHAVVYGRVKEETGTVDAPIGRHPADRKKMCVTDRNSRRAVTRYCVEEYLTGFTHLSVELETGRTHQIRVHMAYMGHPVAGDPVYGPKKVIASLNGQCLHAGLLGFVHPVTKEYMEFSSPMPDYFADFIRKNRLCPIQE